jgi:small-conductance mechanosensitive channel
VDLQERRRLDTSVAKVRAKARPWRSIFALVVAIAGAITAEVSGVAGWSHLGQHHLSEAQRLAYICGAVAFLVFGLAAAVGLSGKALRTSQPLIGQAHAGVLRYVLVLVGVFAVLTFSLAIARIDVKQLLVSGAVAGVLLGIAAQQSLANLFAGLVLLFARPFRVGDHVRFRAGALSGQIEGVVIDVSLTYVRLETDEGQVLLPNSQALAAAVLLIPDSLPGEPADAPATSVPQPLPGSPASSPTGTRADW